MGGCHSHSSVDLAYAPLVEWSSVTDETELEYDYEDGFDGDGRWKDRQDWEMCRGPMFFFKYEVGKTAGGMHAQMHAGVRTCMSSCNHVHKCMRV